jgi:hypothetical protein
MTTPEPAATAARELARYLLEREAADTTDAASRAAAPGIRLDVITAVEGHGAVSAGAAVEALLAAIVELLSDLIGADMVRNLLNQDDHPQAGGRRTH